MFGTLVAISSSAWAKQLLIPGMSGDSQTHHFPFSCFDYLARASRGNGIDSLWGQAKATT
jgi:hypothetical protein